MRSVKQNSEWGSHMPLLVLLLNHSDGPIVEFGAGYYSTSLLDIMCRTMLRHIVSYEKDPVYFKIVSCFISPYHDVYLVDDWDKLRIEEMQWSVALIDHSPSNRRWVEAYRIRNCAKYVLLHDSDHEGRYRYYRVYPHFKYRYDCTKYIPQSTILSNFDDLRWLKDLLEKPLYKKNGL